MDAEQITLAVRGFDFIGLIAAQYRPAEAVEAAIMFAKLHNQSLRIGIRKRNKAGFFVRIFCRADKFKTRTVFQRPLRANHKITAQCQPVLIPRILQPPEHLGRNLTAGKSLF